jgi:hypothetical protein
LQCSVLVEVAETDKGFCLSCHSALIFQDLVEAGIFYVALFPGKEKVVFNPDMLTAYENHLLNYLPGHEKWQTVIQVVILSRAVRRYAGCRY